MNSACLMLTAAWLAGADPVPASPPTTGAPPAVVAGGGCGPGCGPVVSGGDCCDTSGRSGLLSRFRGKHGRKDDCCAPAPAPVTCCAPAPAPRPNLLDMIRSRSHKSKGGCAPACSDPCAAPVGPVVAPCTGTAPPPQEMPKPVDPPKKGNEAAPPAPAAPAVPAVVVPQVPSPLAPAVRPKLNGTTSPY